MSWTSRTSGTTEYLRGVTHDGVGLFVAVGDDGNILTSSDNGTTWTSRTGTSDNLKSVTHGNNTYVVVGQGGVLLTSTDGTTWDNRTSGTTIHLYGVTF